MSSTNDRLPLPDSEHKPGATAKELNLIESGDQIEATIYVRPNPEAKEIVSAEELGAQLPKERHYLSREELEQNQSANEKDLEQVKAFALQYGLAVKSINPARRALVVEGPASAFEAAFGIKLKQYQASEGVYRDYNGTLTVPAALAPIIQGVFGLDNRRLARPSS